MKNPKLAERLDELDALEVWKELLSTQDPAQIGRVDFSYFFRDRMDGGIKKKCQDLALQGYRTKAIAVFVLRALAGRIFLSVETFHHGIHMPV